MVYLSGFGNHHASEALPGALPVTQNSPQTCALGLYAEQLNGSAFTRPRHQNLHTWLYRTLPSAVHQDYIPYTNQPDHTFAPRQAPTPLRWSPQPKLHTPCDFIDGLFLLAGNTLLRAYLYQCNQSMTTRYLRNHDGEFLFVPYEGCMRLRTEMGVMDLSPGMIAVIPRGILFKVELVHGASAGYLCENAGAPLTLPPLGIIGANGLANPRHFLYPQAAFECLDEEVHIICKYQHHYWIATHQQSPLNVVAWHGNYAPYCYDLSLFNPINTVSFDHPDPSIFTVLTSESDTPGIANLDFVIFPPRWMVAEHTFRPPYFHRNMMSEFMGLIKGVYDAKETGFSIGGISIHNGMTAHGPDLKTFQKASKQSLKPEYYADTLAFMFESREPWNVTDTALSHTMRQQDYTSCWQGFHRATLTPHDELK